MKTFNILVSDERLKPVYDAVLKRLTVRGMKPAEEAEFTLVLDIVKQGDFHRIKLCPFIFLFMQPDFSKGIQCNFRIVSCNVVTSIVYTSTDPIFCICTEKPCKYSTTFSK